MFNPNRVYPLISQSIFAMCHLKTYLFHHKIGPLVLVGLNCFHCIRVLVFGIKNLYFSKIQLTSKTDRFSSAIVSLYSGRISNSRP